MAYATPSAWYISSVAFTAVTAWVASHSYAAGAIIRQATIVSGNERIFACIIAGTSGASEPTWVITKGGKTTDNTATWIEVTGQCLLNGDTVHAVPWTASASAALGFVMYESTSGSAQVVTTAGSSTTSKPTFSATAGVTTSDGTIVWTSLGPLSNFSPWTAPFSRGMAALASEWSSAPNDFYLADNHAETQSAALIWSSSTAGTETCRFLSIDHTVGTAPPTGVKAGASVTVTSGALSLGNSGGLSDYYYGITFTASGTITVGGSSDQGITTVFDTCAFVPTSSSMTVSGSSSSTLCIWNNTTVTFAATSQAIFVGGTMFTWRNTPNAVQGSAVTNLIDPSGAAPCDVLIEGCDLSGMATNSSVVHASGAGYVLIKDCKLSSGTVGLSDGGGTQLLTVDVSRSDSGTAAYRTETHSSQGDCLVSTSIVRTSGASDGVTQYSHQITSSTSTQWWLPFLSIPCAIYNATTGATRTVTMYGIANMAALPNNDDFWADVEYPGSASSTLGSFAFMSKANALATGTALTADALSSAWDTQAAARANSTAYSVGQIVKTASNPGRIFFCTASGASTASSEPGGFASAVDGSVITDNLVTWRAGVRFQLTMALSSPQPQLPGYIYVYPKVARPSTTFFLDPIIALS